MTSVQSDVYTGVTDHIVAALEASVRPWIQPWNAARADGSEIAAFIKHRIEVLKP